MIARKGIRIWLMIGLVMIFFQIVIGGITRLTGSGLSITKWEIVTGTLPPLNQEEWSQEFDLYQQTPQYQKINEGMSLSDFKFIYFWEYFHRLWARLMGFVFIIPFAFFTLTGRLRGKLLRQTIILFFLAALVASFGWIMVASGLIERPWVNTYKLTMHLSLAIITFLYLWFVYFNASNTSRLSLGIRQKRFLLIVFVITAVQIIIGGIVAGSKAALAYPTWPDMNGVLIPEVMLTGDAWNWEAFVHYDKNSLFPAFVQFIHRNIAYVLVVAVLFWLYWTRGIREIHWRYSNFTLGTLLILQIILGVMTLLYSVGSIPVWFGVFHQGAGILLISTVFYQVYRVWLRKDVNRITN
jgi:cytochrome c oxidase assembly protein subunit 15